jgi:O-antigen/teichoic acid export membrane protein
VSAAPGSEREPTVDDDAPARVFAGLTTRWGGSAVIIAAGLSLTGLGTLVTMALTARWLVPGQYQAFITWWAVATYFGAGFGVFETYAARLVVKALSEGRSPRPVVAAIAGRAWMSVVLIAVIAVVFNSWIAHTLFQGSVTATLLLPVFVAFAMLQCIQRGIASGHRYFVMNATQFASDGVIRVALVVAVHALARPSMAIFASATCLSAACSVLISFAVFPSSWVRPRLRGSSVSWRPLLYLLLSMASIMLINNGAVVWLSATHSVPAIMLGAFAGVMTLSQIPTQLSSAIASPTLSHLAQALDTGDHVRFRQLHRRVVTLTFWFGLAFVGAFTALGHEVLALYLGPRYTMDRTYMLLLAASSSVMLLAMVEQAVLNSRIQWRKVGVSWTFAALGFFVTLALPVSTIVRAASAPLVSVSVAYVAMTILNARYTRTVSTPHALS